MTRQERIKKSISSLDANPGNEKNEQNVFAVIIWLAITLPPGEIWSLLPDRYRPAFRKFVEEIVVDDPDDENESVIWTNNGDTPGTGKVVAELQEFFKTLK